MKTSRHNRISRQSRISRNCRIALVVAFVVVAAGCNRCKSDAERAAEERAIIEKKARDSWQLLPYRAVKAVARSSASPDKRPQAFNDLDAAYGATLALPSNKELTPAEAAEAAKAYATLLGSVIKMRGELKDHDEDEFPWLYTALKLSPPPPPAYYDNGLEHLGLATVWVVLDVADRGNRVPATEVELYELSRATPAPAWPWVFRTFAELARGTAWTAAGYHYAADEELTRYLAATEESTPDSEFVLGVLAATPAESKAGLRAAGLLVRALNRLQMGRKEQAVEDVEGLLVELDRLGVKNELTLWAHAFVDFHHERYAEAAASLDELAKSEYLDDETKAELTAAAASLRAGARDHVPVFSQARAAALLGTALVARAGGPEAILAKVLGPERAHTIFTPMAQLDRARAGLSKAVDDEKAKGVEALSGALDDVKSKVGDKLPGK